MRVRFRIRTLMWVVLAVALVLAGLAAWRSAPPGWPVTKVKVYGVSRRPQP
jgi:hypothetical protein